MNQIKQVTGTITKVSPLSPTAREYTIRPSEPLSFVAGAFVNLFLEHEGKTMRRAFSMSSSDESPDEFTLSVRLSPEGELTPILWAEDFTGKTIKLMGPLGLNTADKVKSSKVALFGFGIGAGVIKSLAEHMTRRDHLQSLTIMTGSRSTAEILHKDYFDQISAGSDKVSVTYVVSDKSQTEYPAGYIQDHLAGGDFSHTDVYICGQGIACRELEKAIRDTNPVNCNFFIEDFH